ncbi:MAG: MBL fold metallo-hydrolase, partial [Dehalococcoidales bacterium]|nr:MBL fold metallo-hydrolase [Dehalococcoidales bacterium]
DSNTYVIKGSPGVIIDPGSSRYLPALIHAMKLDGIEPEDIGTILNTHLHGDHCGANEGFKEFSGARIALHPVQKENYRTVVVEAARLFGMPPDEFTEDDILEGDTLTIGDVKIDMLPSPGHSPDSVCYYLRDEKLLVCGDVIFEMNTGRTDLPGGNGEQLKVSIERLSQLVIEGLFPGHMGAVTGQEKVVANFQYVRSNVLPWL